MEYHQAINHCPERALVKMSCTPKRSAMERRSEMRTRLSRGRTLIAVSLTLMTSAASASTLNGRVVDIADGDTLTLLVDRQPYIISIAAIDAPERYQAWGDRSKTNLGRLSFNRAAVAHCTGVDRQGHQVCKLTVNNVDIGLEQIKDGMAWWVRNHANGLSAEDQSAYESTELMAKLKRQGLWRDTNPVPPWSFRGEH